MQSDQCLTCKHYWGVARCEAFNDKIPDEIINGLFDHSEPHPGDNGIQWEKIDVKRNDKNRRT